MILSLFGGEPDEVSATGSCFLHPHIADVTTTQLHFPSGQAAHVFVSWLHPVKDEKLVVIGDQGMAVFDDGAAWDAKLLLYPHQVSWTEGIPTPERAEAEPVVVPQGEPLRLECLHFLESVRDGTTPAYRRRRKPFGCYGCWRVRKRLLTASRVRRPARPASKEPQWIPTTSCTNHPSSTRVW